MKWQVIVVYTAYEVVEVDAESHDEALATGAEAADLPDSAEVNHAQTSADLLEVSDDQ